jgi:LemA protein
VIWVIVLLVVVLLLVLAAVALYNRLVRLRNRVDNAWAQIEVQLKRRWDLIPNLVETVKGYAAHERETFEAVTQARARAQQAQTPGEVAQAEGILGAALGRLLAVAEAYPELQASQNFLRLQEDLTDTEDKISAARRYYNSTVMHYNTGIQSIPWVLVARPLGFGEKEFFSAEGDTAPPQVSLTPAT